MATSQQAGQIPLRRKGQKTCKHHKRTKLDHYCEECEVPVCIKCVSTVHKSHPLCSLKEMTPQMKKDIQSFIDKSEKVDIVAIDKFITSTDKHIEDNTNNFESISQIILMQTDKLKDDLDLLATQTLSLYQQMEDDNNKLLQTYKQNLEMYNTQLKQQVQECKIALDSGSDIEIYDAGREVQSSFKIPVKPSFGTASFTPNLSPDAHLEQALGEVDISGQCQGQGQHSLRRHNRSVRSADGQGLHSSQHQSKQKAETTSTKHTPEPEGRKTSAQQRSKGTPEVTEPVYTLLSRTKVLEKWMSQCDITSVCPTSDGQAWTSYSISETLTLLDKKGKVLQKVKHDTGVSDISLSTANSNRNIWACDLENNITELVSGRLVRRFSTHKKPLCICITADNHVVVGIDKHISKFTPEGTLVLTTLAAATGKSLVCTPHRISECPVTLNIAVADRDSKRDGGEGKPHVVVMNKNFKKRFIFDGEIPQKYRLTSESEGERFDLYGLAYDTMGNLIIADHDNNRVFLISGRGEFIKLIHSSDYSTFAVGVDKEDVLWAVFRGKNVKLLQYSSV